jgi:hypothetical protein
MRKAVIVCSLFFVAGLVAIVSFRARELPTLLVLRLGLHSATPDDGGPWVYRVRYKGATAYLFQSGMPDDYDTLYTAEGWEICKPSGGFGGDGDGSCPDALDPKDPRVQVWPTDPERDGGRRSE